MVAGGPGRSLAADASKGAAFGAAPGAGGAALFIGDAKYVSERGPREAETLQRRPAGAASKEE